MARNESVNSENLSDVDALKIIAKENKEYTLEEVNDRFWELTERKLSKTQLNTLWYTVVGITESEDDSKEDSIAEILEKAEKSEFLQASAEPVETLTKKERKSKMVKKVKANSESLSGVIRKILSNNFDLPIVKIKEKCQQIVGKQPSNPLIFQIKAKMKQGKELKSKTKKVSSVSKKLKTVASSDNYILDVTEKVKKAKLLIEEFHGKDNLINFLQAL